MTTKSGEKRGMYTQWNTEKLLTLEHHEDEIESVFQEKFEKCDMIVL